jgi:broad specificity phosphatase PhoE
MLTAILCFVITLIRHGQAGSRMAYDDLSDTGRTQARALGAWFGERGHGFDVVVTGGLTRQKITAEEMLGAMEARGAARPSVEVDARWNEFDLDAVYAGVGPQLAEVDEQFRAGYAQLIRDSADPHSAAHRTWRNCDVTVVHAWIAGRFRYEGESFENLCARVRKALTELPAGANVAVVTSATPIGICLGSALDVAPKHIMRLAAGFNSAYSELDLRHDGPRVVSYNNVPHLTDVRLRTLR